MNTPPDSNQSADPAPQSSHPTGLNLIPIDDFADPRLVVFANQRDQWLRARHRPAMQAIAGPDSVHETSHEPVHPEATGTGLPGDLFIAEGDKVVAQLISSPHHIISVMVSEHRLDHHLPYLAGIQPETPIYVVSRAVIDEVAGFQVHRGLLACGKRAEPGDAIDLARRSRLVVVLENLTNHDNVGGVFRNVRALAPSIPHPDQLAQKPPRETDDANEPIQSRQAPQFPACVLLTPRCCDPLYRKSLRVSMGNALHVPFAYLKRWPHDLSELVSAGCNPLAMTLTPDSVDLHTCQDMFDRDMKGTPHSIPTLIMGTEGPGLASTTADAVRSLGGRIVRIDIEQQADSLNVSVACAIALHHLRSVAQSRPASEAHRDQSR